MAIDLDSAEGRVLHQTFETYLDTGETHFEVDEFLTKLNPAMDRATLQRSLRLLEMPVYVKLFLVKGSKDIEAFEITQIGLQIAPSLKPSKRVIRPHIA